jgi:Transposase DDE domain
VERVEGDRDLLVVGGTPAFPGVGRGGRLSRDLAARPGRVRQGGRDRLGLAGGGRCDGEVAVGWREDRAEPDRPRKKGAKRSLLCEARGVPIGLAHDGANRHDVKLLAATLDSIPVPRPGPTNRRPQRLCLDRGYDYASVREIVDARDYSPHIRSRGEELKLKIRVPGWKARRWVVEACHSWLNRNRALLIRWSKKDDNHLALLQLACGLIAFKKAHHATLAVQPG